MAFLAGEAENPGLYYEVHGGGPDLILIHGLGSSLQDWEYQIPVFAKYFRVHALDLRGFGRSDKPDGPYSIPVLAQDILRFMDQLHLQQAHIVGISMGGWIGLQLAVSHPQRIASLTAVNCGADVIPKSLKQWFELLLRLVLFRFLSMERIGDILSRRLFPGPDQVKLRETLAARWAENHKAIYLKTFQGLVGWSVAGQLGQIQCPTHIITAEHDYTDLASKQNMVNLIPNATLTIIENTRHALPLEQPEQFNQASLGFLREIEPSAN
ncbi:MAG: alpha/beta hydrolase [Gammaproteobacteria bacterium]|nr:alpha/beta hydrolase [Gammaproteobacteria bacterium]MDH5803006.1 alpha/beta hydrolase [Gammaproteobacteria bacterium]